MIEIEMQKPSLEEVEHLLARILWHAYQLDRRPFKEVLAAELNNPANLWPEPPPKKKNSYVIGTNVQKDTLYRSPKKMWL